MNASGQVNAALDDVLREGARRLLVEAIEAEVDEYIEKHQHERDEKGHRLVVRNGYGKERRLLTGLGELAVQAPRVNDKRRDATGRRIRFTSKILPPYLRKTRSVEELIPWLYLKGISTGDFGEALAALLGPLAKGLSSSSVVRFLGDKYAKATACLEDDREALLAFYDFPAAHWVHLRTTNPIESTFATVRLRHRRTKGCGSRQASLTMVSSCWRTRPNAVGDASTGRS